MQLLKAEFKGKVENHILLDPDDIDTIESIRVFSTNALRKNGPWANENQHEKYAEVIDWFANKIKQHRISK